MKAATPLLVALQGVLLCQQPAYGPPSASALTTTGTTATVQACATSLPGYVPGAGGGIDLRFQTLADFLTTSGSAYDRFSVADPGVCRAILTTPLSAGQCGTAVLGASSATLVYEAGCNVGLTCGTSYKVFVAANRNGAIGESDAVLVDVTTQPCNTCGTFTQGYWKNHEEVWPVNSLILGTVTYTKADLLAILGTPVRGNGLVSLAHQLIAAKLNVANGAGCPAAATAINSADALIGSAVVPPSGSDTMATSTTGGLTTSLDNFNNGKTSGCPSHCN